MDEYAHNALSHSAKAKPEGELKKRRRLTVLGYILFSVVYAVGVTVPVQLYPALGALPFFLLAFWRITWWRLDYDYDYLFAHGELTVERVWSHSRRRVMARVAVKDATEVAPLAAGATPPRAARLLDLRASLSAAGNYYIRYRGEDGRDTVLLFETNAKVVKAMAKYNPATVIAEGLPL